MVAVMVLRVAPAAWPDDILLIPEVARVARASESTVRWWIATGRLRSFRPGRRRLIRRSDLESFIERGHA